MVERTASSFLTRFPLGYRVFNHAMRGLQAVGLRSPALTPDAVERAVARRRGGRDPRLEDVRAPLEVLAAAAAEARLHPLGHVALQEAVVASLVRRTQLIHDTSTPGDRRLRPTVFIVGLPRSGTTLLQRLLCAHPDALWLPLWLQLHPEPLPSRALLHSDDHPRLRATRRMLAWSPAAHSDLDVRHEVRAEAPEECTTTLGETLLSSVYADAWPVHGYLEWLLDQDNTPAYRHLHRRLRYLQGDIADGHWALKAPWHLSQIRTLLEVFPDAMIVHTHRDPTRVLASVFSMLATAHGATAEALEIERMVSVTTCNLRLGIERAMAVRDELGSDRFLDVRFDDLVADPLGEVQRVHRSLGLRWDDEVAAAVGRTMDANPRHKHGIHRYSLADFGTTEAQVLDLFGDYIQRFELKP